MTSTTRDDTRRLMFTLNRALGEALEPDRLDRAFDRIWVSLETALSHARQTTFTTAEKTAMRDPNDMFAEILTRLRAIEQKVMTPAVDDTARLRTRIRELAPEHRAELRAILQADGLGASPDNGNLFFEKAKAVGLSIAEAEQILWRSKRAIPLFDS